MGSERCIGDSGMVGAYGGDPGDGKYCGRSAGLRLAQRPAFQKVSGGCRVTADQSIRRWIAGRVKEWRHLTLGGDKAQQEAARLLVKNRKYTPPFKRVPNEWKSWKAFANRLSSSTTSEEVHQMVKYLEGVAKRAEGQARWSREKPTMTGSRT